MTRGEKNRQTPGRHQVDPGSPETVLPAQSRVEESLGRRSIERRLDLTRQSVEARLDKLDVRLEAIDAKLRRLASIEGLLRDLLQLIRSQQPPR